MSSLLQSQSPVVQAGKWLSLTLIALAGPMLACGTFVTQFPIDSAAPESTVLEQATPIPTSTPIIIPTPVPPGRSGEALAQAGTGNATQGPGVRVAQSAVDLTAGEKARVIATGGINLRSQASIQADIVSQLQFAALVTVMDGPFQSEDLYWWQVETVEGSRIGMLAEGVGSEPWLEPATGTRIPVEREPVAGDTVVVAIDRLNVRSSPSISGTVVTTLSQGQELSILEGPEPGDGYVWYRVRAADGTFTGWSAYVIANTKALLPLE